MDTSSPKIIKKIILDFLCLSIVSLPILCLKLFGKPFHRGFFCDDESIKFSYKSSTVPNYALYIVGIVLPVFFMLFTERIYSRGSTDERFHTYICGRRIPLWICNSYKVIGVFLFGAACSQLTTDIAKYMIGRLRPHFIDVCKPDIDCSNPAFRFQYITEFSCTKTNAALIKDARLSFPSGHSSFSAFTMVYLAIYVHVKMKWEGSYLVKSLFQFACICLSWMTGLSRVSDYKHHWTDVTAGFIIGVTVAIITTKFISNLFEKHNNEVAIVCNETTALSSTSPVIIEAKEPTSIEL